MENKIKPVMILPKGEVSKRNIKTLRDNGICVVEAEHPENVRFAEPPPNGYSEQEKAAIKLFRVLMGRPGFGNGLSRMEFASLYAQMLIDGTPLAPIKKV